MRSWKLPCGMNRFEVQLSKLMHEKESALAVDSVLEKITVECQHRRQIRLCPTWDLSRSWFYVGLTCLRPLRILLTSNHGDYRCGMVFRLHPWSPSCTAATLCLCWNSEHNLDCLRHVLHLNCSIVILILCGRNTVCNNWGYYRKIGGRGGTDVEQACGVGLKPVGKSWDVLYISCIFFIPSLILAYWCVMWNSF